MTDHAAICADVDPTDPEQVRTLLCEFTGLEWERAEAPACGAVNLRYEFYDVDVYDDGFVVFENECGDETGRVDLPALLRALDEAGLRKETKRPSFGSVIEQAEKGIIDVEPCHRCAELEDEVARLREALTHLADACHADWVRHDEVTLKSAENRARDVLSGGPNA